MNARLTSLLCLALATAIACSQPVPYVPDAKELQASYQRADALRAKAFANVYNVNIDARWLDATNLAYLRTTPHDRTIMLANATTKAKKPAFDHGKVAVALAKALNRSVEVS